MSAIRPTLPVFEELYVVSDLHLGGTTGWRIFAQGARLAALVRELTNRQAPRGGSLGLVLNGDTVDTLAENLPDYVADPSAAEAILDRIMRHDDFAEIFVALSAFVSTQAHHLEIVLGNHDLELVYPTVQECLLRRLAGSDETRRARVTFATSGAGVRCAVGSDEAGFATTLCVHGNEFDKWNAVSPESMTRLTRAAVLGKDSPLLGTTPNAGTKLVKDVMNGIKKDWPFVDLLKPEMETAFTVMLALVPDRVAAVPGFASAFRAAETTGAGRVARVLGGAQTPGAPGAVDMGVDWAPGPGFAGFLGGGPNLSVEAAWERVLKGNVDPADLAEGGTLGFGDFVVNNWNRWVASIRNDPMNALRTALVDWAGTEKTWELDGPCEVFDKLEELQPDAAVVVAGHTHLRRQKRLGRGTYLNTGTWARLMRLTPRSLATADAFEPIWKAFRAGSMEALDELPDEVVFRQPTVAVIREENGRISAGLCEAPKGPPVLVKGASFQPVGMP